MAFAFQTKPKAAPPVSTTTERRGKPAFGNRAVGAPFGFEAPVSQLRLTKAAPPVVQTKLKVGEPNDRFEQEADDVAEAIMRMPESAMAAASSDDDNSGPALIPLGSAFATPTSDLSPCRASNGHTIQGAPSLFPLPRGFSDRSTTIGITAGGFKLSALPALRVDGGSRRVQRLCHKCEEESRPNSTEEIDERRVQLKANPAGEGQNEESQLSIVSGESRALPQYIRAFYEPRFGYDFSSVRIHADSKAAENARQLQASAFTVGSHIAFGHGQYNPSTPSGRRLLAHELTHVVQQGHAPAGSLPRVVQRAPGPRKKGGEPPKQRAVDIDTAKKVMWSIIQIINRQDPTEPEKWVQKDEWFLKYKDLLITWYTITYGEKTKQGRTRLKGDTLRQRVDEAMAATQPLLDVLRSKGGKQWKDLRQFFYPKVAEFEVESEEPRPKTPIGKRGPIEWPENPEEVSPDDFFRVVATQNSQTVEISRGYGRFSVGDAKTGDVFSVSQQEQRMLLWSNGYGVFYMDNGRIFKQQLQWFSEDVIFGAFITAAQNAAGAAILAQLMVEISLSFTPWGLVADGVFALKAMTEGDWKGAALTLVPGVGIGLATATKTGRAALRATAAVAKAGIKAIKGTIKFIGRGAFEIGGKIKRGLWVIGEGAGKAGGKAEFSFFDEVEGVWHAVPEETASKYLKCNTCTFTASGKGLSKEAALAEIIEDVPAVYKSKDVLLLDKKLLEEVREAYGDLGEHVISDILEAWEWTGKEAYKHANDTLKIAKDLAHIKQVAKGRKAEEFMHDAVEIFQDLASKGETTARGAMYELEWAAAHADEIERLALPVAAKPEKAMKGLDVLKKGGEAVELKNFKFTSQFYAEDPERAVARIIKQLESRFSLGGIEKATVVFNSKVGKMPRDFERVLEEGLAVLENSLRSKGLKLAKPPALKFEMWP
jgi:Domain of unknown function (DUF4157)